MKWISISLVSALLTCSGLADSTAKIEHPTKRMTAISEKYHIEPIYTFHDSDKNADFWVFLGRSDKRLFHALPVVVPANATNHDVEISIMSAENCASFYELLIQKQKEESTETQGFRPGV